VGRCVDRKRQRASPSRNTPFGLTRTFSGAQRGEFRPDAFEIAAMPVDRWDASLQVVEQPGLDRHQALDARIIVSRWRIGLGHERAAYWAEVADVDAATRRYRGRMELRTDRLGLLVDQLVQSRELSSARLEGLTDDEYLWEPVGGMWSIRRRSEASTPDAYGRGDWVLDFERIDPFEPGPLTTIAWRVGHIISMYAGRWEWTFGDRSTDPKDIVEFTTSADDAATTMWDWIDRWVARIDRLTDAELDMVGYGQYPQGLDPHLPFIGILWWMNRETIHHLAEVALLRDLYLRRDELRPDAST
jgi:DinB superfamily